MSEWLVGVVATATLNFRAMDLTAVLLRRSIMRWRLSLRES